MNDKADTLTTKVSTLAAKFTHDIRTPLAHIALKAKVARTLLADDAVPAKKEQEILDALQVIEMLSASISQATTKFWDDLHPLVQEPSQLQADTLSPLSTGLSVKQKTPSKMENIRVLLIEDNEINQEVALAMLSQLGCDVASAVNGSHALSLVEGQRFDLILADYWLPDMNGSELARKIRQIQTHLNTPIVGLTASPNREDHAKATAAGMDICVTKPITLKLLKSLLARYCQKPEH
ncbi:MAG: response regulator [Cellvibrionaceae bacterium]|nr:response regulator [Cellvibrionaceae bacterium]